MRDLYPLYQTDFDDMKTCSFDIVYGFNYKKDASQMSVLRKVLKDKISKTSLFKCVYNRSEIPLRKTASPLTMITLNEGQRTVWEDDLFKVGFKRICSWMNWREGHTVHMYVHATHDQTNTPESWTMGVKDELITLHNKQPYIEELPEGFWPDTPTKMEV